MLQQVARTPLWQSLSFVRENQLRLLPPVWFYGATLSAMRFVRLLEQAWGESTMSAISLRQGWRLPAGLLGLLVVIAVSLTFYNLSQLLPSSLWSEALWRPDRDDVRQMLFHYSQLPRLAVALLTGAGLGLVGVLFQQVLRNPLAEPATLGGCRGCPVRANDSHTVDVTRW